ncbi:MAG: FHA domain-containing protein [Actinomycetota bacterium]
MYCPDCGFPQSEAHRYCSRCGALLAVEGGTGDTTGPFAVPDVNDDGSLPPLRVQGPALAVRSGGGLSGEVFPVSAGRLTIGRAPDSDVFLDDVTVSRHHATVTVTTGGVVLEDLGSMNGTYVNRRRIEGGEELQDGDELQIGKFRLAYIA